MLRISKRILATILATAMVFTMADYSGIHLLVENVSASTDQNKYSDSKVVNEEIIPDTELRNALKDIISNGNDLTFKELKEYEGDLDLSNYPQIQEVTGLGYMRLVKNMDLSTLSKVKKIDKYEFQMCNLTSIKLPENLEEIDYKVPRELKATLRDYQLTGFKWFKTLSHYEFGGILADEMGLGKTVQTIAFLLSEKNKKSIIVTPTSLIYNWRSEFEKFAPTMKIKIVHGNKEDREFSKDEIKDIDVLITTYGTLRNDYNLYEDITFDFCIIDEGQNIKNPLSQSSEVVKELKAKVKFALTGTPIENNLIELWSLFD